MWTELFTIRLIDAENSWHLFFGQWKIWVQRGSQLEAGAPTRAQLELLELLMNRNRSPRPVRRKMKGRHAACLHYMFMNCQVNSKTKWLSIWLHLYLSSNKMERVMKWINTTDDAEEESGHLLHVQRLIRVDSLELRSLASHYNSSVVSLGNSIWNWQSIEK